MNTRTQTQLTYDTFLNRVKACINSTGYSNNNVTYYTFTTWSGLEVRYSLTNNRWTVKHISSGYSSNGYSLLNAKDGLECKLATIGLFKALGYTDNRLFDLIS